MNDLLEQTLKDLSDKKVSNVVFIVDVSGGMDLPNYAVVSKVILRIASRLSVPVLVVYVDEEYAGHQMVFPTTREFLIPVSKTRSDIRTGFKFIEGRGLKPDLVVCFTGGLCDLFPDEPDYHVMWVQLGPAHFKPPFGENILF